MKSIWVIVMSCLVFCGGVSFANAQVAPANAKDANTGTYEFSCTFWKMPKDAPQLFVKEGKDYKYLSVFEMAFSRVYTYKGSAPIPIFRKATAEEIEQRKTSGAKKADLEYVPLFGINPQGMKKIGVLFLPGNLAEMSEKNIIVFNDDEAAFPYGSVRVYNFSGQPLLGQFEMAPAGEKNNFTLNQGGVFLFSPKNKEQAMAKFRLAARVNKKPYVLYSTGLVVREDTKVSLFVIPDVEKVKKSSQRSVPFVDVRSVRKRKPYEPPTNSERAKNNNGD